MHVLIVGEGKSGTSALCYAIAAALPGSVVYFEPEHPRNTDRLQHQNTVTKIVLEQEVRSLEKFAAEFDRCIFVVRDPRDNFISRALYAAYPAAANFNERKVSAHIERLRAKENDKLSYSMLEIVRQFEVDFDIPVVNGSSNASRLAVEFWSKAGANCHIFKYEDFVAGRFDALEHYLGFVVPHGIDVPNTHQRVVRTKSSGDWKRWFTEEDVEFFRPLMREFMQCFGYEDDWELGRWVGPFDPAYGSDYVKRVFHEGLSNRLWYDEEKFRLRRVCNICGGRTFAEGPGGRISNKGLYPLCCKCESLERHRIVREVFRAIPNGFLDWRRALLLGNSTGINRNWFRSFGVMTRQSVLTGLMACQLANGSFDLISMELMLEFFAADLAVFKKLVNALSANGILHVTFSAADSREVTEDCVSQPGSQGPFRLYGRDFQAKFQCAEQGLSSLVVRETDPCTATRLTTHFFCKNPLDAMRLRSWISASNSTARIIS